MRSLFPARTGAVASLALVACGALLTAAPAAHAQTLNTFNRGWVSEFGNQSVGNDNYSAGFVVGTQYRDWFAFNVPTLAAGMQYTSATFRFNTFNVITQDAFETLAFRDYTGSIASLLAGNGGSAAYDDLANGANYGSVTLTPAQSDTFVTVTLSASALADLNLAAGNQFVLGGFISTLGAPTAVPEVIAGGSLTGNPADGNTQLTLTAAPIAGTAAPEPGSLSLLGMSALPLLGRAVRRRKAV